MERRSFLASLALLGVDLTALAPASSAQAGSAGERALAADSDGHGGGGAPPRVAPAWFWQRPRRHAQRWPAECRRRRLSGNCWASGLRPSIGFTVAISSRSLPFTDPSHQAEAELYAILIASLVGRAPRHRSPDAAIGRARGHREPVVARVRRLDPDPPVVLQLFDLLGRQRRSGVELGRFLVERIDIGDRANQSDRADRSRMPWGSPLAMSDRADGRRPRRSRREAARNVTGAAQAVSITWNASAELPAGSP